MSTQQTDAIALLQHLRTAVIMKREPINGYTTAAALIGRVTADNDGRYMGQVCSRIDLACLYSGLPMLAYHYVRRVNGEINPNAWGTVQEFVDEIATTAAAHLWTEQELDSVSKHLLRLPAKSSRSLWDDVEERGPAFFRYNLHRALRQ